jgi:hypothetical protein
LAHPGAAVVDDYGIQGGNGQTVERSINQRKKNSNGAIPVGSLKNRADFRISERISACASDQGMLGLTSFFG